MPPAALISSVAISAPPFIQTPYEAPEPVSGRMAPILMGGCCAPAGAAIMSAMRGRSTDRRFSIEGASLFTYGNVGSHGQPERSGWAMGSQLTGARAGSREPLRLSRRLHSLRGWGHGESKQVFPGGARASSADGVRACPGAPVAVGGDHLDRREDGLCRGDAPEMGAPGRAGPGCAAGTDDRGAAAVQ